MFRCLFCVFAALISCPSTSRAPAQEPYYVSGNPVQTTYADGWFRHESGHVEHWRAGKIVEHASPGGKRWDEVVATIPQRAKQNLGLIPMPPFPGEGEPLTSDWRVSGVQADKIPQGVAYEINGKAVTRDAVFRTMQSTGLADDRAKPFLTAVLPDASRQQFLADVESHPALQPWRGKFHINAYSLNDFHVSQIGLAEGVSYQPPPTADGKSKVQFRLRAYSGPEALAQSLREVDPNYRPDTDPDGKPKPKADPQSDGGEEIDVEQTTRWGAFGAVWLSGAALALRRRFGV